MSTPPIPTETEPSDITGSDVAAYVGDRSGDGFADSCAAEACALVARYLGAQALAVPVEVARRAQLEVAAELFHRRKAPNGIQQFATANGEVGVRVARDPMLGAYPLLDRYVSGGFA